MPIETLDDIIEKLADKVGVYGAHNDDSDEPDNCRVCWTSELRDRLEAAISIERKLYPQSFREDSQP